MNTRYQFDANTQKKKKKSHILMEKSFYETYL